MTQTPNDLSEEVVAATPTASPFKLEGPKINMELVQQGTQDKVAQSHDMFFSCCDWEAAMEAEKKGFTSNPKVLAESSSDHEDSAQKTAENKRNRKAAEKSGPTVSRFEDQDQFDVDLVMKKVAGPNSTERVVSAKKHSSKSKKRHSHKKKHETCSQGSSHPSLTHGDKKQADAASLAALYGTCLSPMGNKARESSDLFQNTV